MKRFLLFIYSTFILNVSAFAQTSTNHTVDTMIVIAVDVSGSIANDEYEIQKEGVINAFRDPEVQNLLDQCTTNGIGVTYVEWSGAKSGPLIQQVVPWTLLQNPQDMEDFSQKLSEMPRSSQGETDIATALMFSHQLFLEAPFESDHKIVSLSTDGRQGFTTAGVDIEKYVQNTRDQLAANSISINAIAIEKQPTANLALSAFSSMISNPFGAAVEPLEIYLKRNVIIGPRTLAVPVSDFKAYSDVFKKQISVMFNGCIS